MTDALGAALEAQGLRAYKQDIAEIEQMEPTEQRAAALQIIKKLAGLRFHLDYATEDHAQRFEHLWQLACPEELGEKRSKDADVFEARSKGKKADRKNE
jgi:hypothetical protein